MEWSIVPIPSNPSTIKRANDEDKTEFFNFVLQELVGDKFTDEEIEKLTVKGVRDVISGEDAKKIQEEDEQKKITQEKINKNKLKGIQLQVYTRLKQLQDDN